MDSTHDSGLIDNNQPAPSQKPQKKISVRVLVFAIMAMIVLALVSVWLLKRDATAPSMSRGPTTMPTPVSADTPDIKVSEVVTGRTHIWDMGMLPSGELLFTERAGTLSILRKDGRVTQLARINDVAATGEGGLLGLAVDSEFAGNRYIYACFNTAADIKVARWRVAPDLGALTDRRDIVSGIPANTTTYPGRHSGCQVEFGPDETLWIGTGDVAKGDTAIQPKSLGGKVLKIDRDGKPKTVPIAGFDNRIFSYGHRNIQGLAFFAKERRGVVGVSVEHGSHRDDEVNELVQGNFGWAPPAEGYDESVPMTDLRRFPDAVKAMWSSGEPTQAPSGAAIIQGTAWKGWNNAIAVAMLKGQHLKILHLDMQTKVTKEEKALDQTYGRLRAVTMGNDGNLYVSTSNGTNDRILRLNIK